MSNRILKVNRGDSLKLSFPVSCLPVYDDKYLANNEAIYFALNYPHQRFE